MFISERVNITHVFEPDLELEQHTDFYQEKVEAEMEQEVCYVTEALDCRFSRVRTQETSLSNMIADLMKTELDADLALTNGGSLRANKVFEPGLLKLRFMSLVLPMTDIIERIRMKGSLFIDALENAVSKYPKHEGRFPVVSGIRFKFDPEQPEGQRIMKDSITDD